MMLRPLGLLTAPILVASLALAAAANAADSIYWSNTHADSISRAALDGSGAENLALPAGAPVDSPSGTAIDAATGTIYWANFDENTIGWARLDGSVGGSLNVAGSEIDEPAGLAIDSAGGKLYWGNQGNDKISWAALDGSGGGVLSIAGAPTPSDPQAVMVYPARNKIYWANTGNITFGVANLDGTGGGEMLPVQGVQPSNPDGLAADPISGKLYWVNATSPQIDVANIDGSGGEVLATGSAPIQRPVGLAIGGNLYWGNQNGNSIGFAAPNGSGTGGELAVHGATLDEPDYPVILEKPRGAPEPAFVPIAEVGRSLDCQTDVFEPDSPEAFDYRAPQTVTIAWRRDGAKVAGADSDELTPSISGNYVCQVTGANAAGSTVVSFPFSVVAKKSGEPGRPVLPHVSFSKVQLDRRHGTATVFAEVSGPGTVTLHGHKIVKRTTKAPGAGTAKLKVSAKGKARHMLMRTGKLAVSIAAEFAASGGGSASAARSIVLHRSKK